MTGSNTTASRPEYPRSHRDAPNRRGAPTRANMARKQRLFGAFMMLMTILALAALYGLISWGGHPCYETEGFTASCNNLDEQRLGVQLFGGIACIIILFGSLQRLWKGV